MTVREAVAYLLRDLMGLKYAVFYAAFVLVSTPLRWGAALTIKADHDPRECSTCRWCVDHALRVGNKIGDGPGGDVRVAEALLVISYPRSGRAGVLQLLRQTILLRALRGEDPADLPDGAP